MLIGHRCGLTVLASGFVAAAIVACSSSGGPPKASTSSNKVDAASANDDVGKWTCYPELGTYVVHYTKKPSDEGCVDEADTDIQVLPWDGPMPAYPDCTVTADKAKCTITTVCQKTSIRASINENTVTVFAKGKTPPVTGTRKVTTGTVAADGGPLVFECNYDFTYTKK